MKLYFSPGACSLAPHIALIAAGLQHETEKVDLRTKKYSGGDFREVNPNGYVPALQLDNGEILTEVQVLLRFIADQKPESNLAPKSGQWERYRLEEWMNFVSTEVHKRFSVLFTADRMVQNEEGKEQLRASIKEQLGMRFSTIAGQLEKHPYLLGDHFTVADAYLYTVLRWSKMMGIEMSNWAPLENYMNRVAELPFVQKALSVEGIK